MYSAVCRYNVISEARSLHLSRYLVAKFHYHKGESGALLSRVTVLLTLFDLRVSLESFSTDKNIVTLEYKDKTGFL
jgi:hypothetical protein